MSLTCPGAGTATGRCEQRGIERIGGRFYCLVCAALLRAWAHNWLTGAR